MQIRRSGEGAKAKQSYLFLVALLGGVIGGCVTTYAVLAHTRSRPESIIRAHRFELIDDSGQVRSFWGTDSAGYQVLVFGAAEGLQTTKARDENQHLALGLQGKEGRPFVRLVGSDGQIRVLLDLDDFERPTLAMSDAGALGLTLGSERSDTPELRSKSERWTLDFLPKESARIGVLTEEDQAGVYARGVLRVSPDKTRYAHSQ